MLGSLLRRLGEELGVCDEVECLASQGETARIIEARAIMAIGWQLQRNRASFGQ